MLVTHKDPDIDALGSTLALNQYLLSLGKQTTVWVPDVIEDAFLCLPYLDQLSKELPAEYDTVIFLDCSNLDRVRHAETLKTDVNWVNIDHHADNTFFGALNWVETEASSVGEMMYVFLTHAKAQITPEMATLMYCAISFDTGRFLYSNVKPSTFHAAAELMTLGAQVVEMNQKLYESKPYTAFEMIKIALEGLVVNLEKQYAYTCIPLSAPHGGIKIVDFIRQLEGVHVIVVFTELENNEVRVNLRSKQSFNVSAFAAPFGGGGHKQASGITVQGTLEEARKKIIQALDAALTV